MNLLEIKQRLESLGEIGKHMPTVNGETIQGLNRFRAFVKKVHEIPGITPFIARIEQIQAFQSLQDDLRLNPDLRIEIISAANFLQNYLESIRTLLISLGLSPATEADVYIKLSSVDDLPGLTSQLGKLQMILEQTILDPKIGGKMEIRSVERGSIWVHIFLGTVTAVTFVGSVAWAAAVVYRKIQEGRIVEQHVESLKIKNDSLREIQEAQKELIKGLVHAEGRHLETEIYGGEENPERLERIKHAIRLMQELVEKGAEVHPALLAPENVKNLFPDFKKLTSVESRIKQITETASS